MYDKRRHCVPAYFMDVFTAGSTSTQRSENINSFFDGYVNASTPLNDFVQQYDNALRSRRKAEKDEDFKTTNSKPIYVSDLAIEKQAGELYTRKMFALFQNEFTSNFSYFKEKTCTNGCVTEYIVGKSTSLKGNWKNVQYDPSGHEGGTLSCVCVKFETEGMLCRYIICLMRAKKFVAIPQKYILRRWIIAAKYKPDYERHVRRAKEVTPLMEFAFRQKMNCLFSLASSSIEHYNRYYAWMDEVLKEEKQKEEVAQPNNIVVSNMLADLEHIHPMHDPIGPVETKGRTRKL